MSKIEVNTIEPQCGTTLTLGASGDTVALASGASQTGFGRTGTVDWITTPKTVTFTAVSGEGYFCNTTAAILTVNLPAGSAGNIVSLADYAATWQTNNVTVAPNGTDKIGALNQNAILSTEGQSVTFVYVDATQGWINTMDSTSNVRGVPPFIAATGGTITTVCTDYKVHTFIGPGTFTVTNAGTPAGSDTVDYMVVAGGGAGGGNGCANTSGGGGAGGFRESPGTASGSYTVSPLGVAPAVALPVTATAFPITVGGGGTGAPCARGTNGSNSIFSSITSTGGGTGGGPIPASPTSGVGSTGGSGGGAGAGNPAGAAGGAGNTPSVSPPQGQNGGLSQPGNTPDHQSGAGGGAGGTGGVGTSAAAGTGGTGVTTIISGSSTAYAGGGGGTGYFGAPGVPVGLQGNGSSCGTGGQGIAAASPYVGEAGTINRGGGGGAAEGYSPPGTVVAATGGGGGSGIVIIRYKFQ
mgnify:CR=1 FL=1